MPCRALLCHAAVPGAALTFTLKCLQAMCGTGENCGKGSTCVCPDNLPICLNNRCQVCGWQWVASAAAQQARSSFSLPCKSCGRQKRLTSPHPKPTPMAYLAHLCHSLDAGPVHRCRPPDLHSDQLALLLPGQPDLRPLRRTGRVQEQLREWGDLLRLLLLPSLHRPVLCPPAVHAHHF